MEPFAPLRVNVKNLAFGQCEECVLRSITYRRGNTKNRTTIEQQKHIP